jgi:hypothetical protein
MELKSKILSLRELIFEYKIQEAMKYFDEIILEVIKLIECSKGNIKENLLEMVKYLEISLLNKDYLLFTDILTYELIPLIKDNTEEEYCKDE